MGNFYFTVKTFLMTIVTFTFLMIFGFMVSVQAANDIGSVGTPAGVPTFECIGITMNFSGDDNKNSVCNIKYRKQGDATWKNGHPLWIDYRLNASWGINSRQFRGSIVNLTPNTNYEIGLDYTDIDGGSGSKTLTVKTWSEKFPEGTITTVTNRTSALSISTSGTASAYAVYQPAAGQSATIDAASISSGVDVRGNYVIIRRLKIINAQMYGILIGSGCHDIIIEDCEITNWGWAGTSQGDTDKNWQKATGINVTSGVKKLVIQHNYIHTPRGCSNSWAVGHPGGPQPVSLNQTLGNHVIRYNQMISDNAHMYNDVIGGGDNGGTGNVKCDTDIYGNIMSHFYDDGIEAEGLDINIRIWGNYIHSVGGMYAIATANVGWTSNKIDNSLGPMYLYRNVIQNCGGATKIRWDGGYYFYHNTVLKTVSTCLEAPNDPASAETKTVGVVKNNIIESDQPMNRSYSTTAAALWFFDYDLYSKSAASIGLNVRYEKHGIFSTVPQYDVSGYTYYLKAGTKGIDAGELIPNFSDVYSGSAPDMGACESGAYFMRAGPHADTLKLPTHIIPIKGSNLKSSLNFNPASVAVYDLLGRLCFSTQKTENIWPDINQKFSNNSLFENVGSGNYLVLLKNHNKTFSKKLLIYR